MADMNNRTMILGLGLVFSILTFVARADDFQALSREVAREGRITILAGSWRPVTGDINPADLETAISGAPDREREIQTLMQAVAQAGGSARPLRQYRYLALAAYEVDAIALEAMKSRSETMQVWSDPEISISLEESVPMTGAPRIWGQGHDGHGQTIAVLDAGMDAGHPFFGGRVVREVCFTQDDCPNGEGSMYGKGAAMTPQMHGTHVAGIAAGAGAGLKGVSPGADIIALKVLQDDGKGRASDVLAGLDYLLHLVLNENLSLAAVNMSLGAESGLNRPCPENPFEGYARLFRARGIILVAAAGNAGKKDSLGLPACAPSIVSVGAVDDNFQEAAFSNRAPFLDLFAPGVNIISAADKRGYWELSGTSMAAPHVTGAIALLRARSSQLPVEDILSALQSGRQVGGTGIPLLELSATDPLPASSDAERAGETVPEPVKEPVTVGPIPIDGDSLTGTDPEGGTTAITD